MNRFESNCTSDFALRSEPTLQKEGRKRTKRTGLRKNSSFVLEGGRMFLTVVRSRADAPLRGANIRSVRNTKLL
jgi:hypothetical protein